MMKINKLRKLSQIIEFLYSEKAITADDFNPKGMLQVKAGYFDSIVNYMQFIDRKPIKEMFINEIEKPKILSDIEKKDDGKVLGYQEDSEIWQEAEKKVMFNGFKSDGVSINNGLLHIFWYDDINLIWKLSKGLSTLSQLAEMSNGELIIKETKI